MNIAMQCFNHFFLTKNSCFIFHLILFVHKKFHFFITERNGMQKQKADHLVSNTYEALRGLDEGSIHAVHLMIETARVAEIVSGAVPSPQGG